MKAAAVTLVAALALVGAGCGGSDSSEAETPTNAATVTNGAETTATGGGSEGGGEGGEAGGDAAAGKTAFEGTCQGCHLNGGNEAGAGPQLAGKGLTADVVKTTVTNGKNAMPKGLASGDDLENIAAYVVSIQ